MAVVSLVLFESTDDKFFKQQAYSDTLLFCMVVQNIVVPFCPSEFDVLLTFRSYGYNVTSISRQLRLTDSCNGQYFYPKFSLALKAL